MRGSVGASVRGHTAISQTKASDWDLDEIFVKKGVGWLHTGGIYAALSKTSAQAVIDVCKAAKESGTLISYDLNYRPSLWKSIGGLEKAREVNTTIAPHIDVMIGNEEDFTASLGLEIEGVDENLNALPLESFAAMILWARPNTLAAPPMSFFISSMPEAGLMSRPPVSKQTPLPTRVTLGSRARPQVKSISRGARGLALPTWWISGKSRSSGLPFVTLSGALNSPATARAAFSSSSGPMSEAGVLIRSRVRNTARAARMMSVRSTPAGHTSLAASADALR